MDTVIHLGNTAPTNTVKQEVSQEEVDAAKDTPQAPLYHQHHEADGSVVFTKLVQVPTGDDAALTRFVIPHSASLLNAGRDLGLAFMRQHSTAAPAWVHSTDEYAARLIAQHLGSLHGVEVPALDLATLAQVMDPQPPAVGELPVMGGGAIQATGRDLWAQVLADPSGDAGTSTGTGATTLTDSGKGWTTNQWKYKDVSSGGKVATILSNTATALTVSRWETPGSRSGAVASTPATGTYVIGSGACPAYWVALTANSATPTTGGADTTLTGEITTASGGLIRAVAVYGHTLGTNTYTLTNTFTANGSDTLSVVIAKVGVFNAQNGGALLFETLLGSTATLNNSGDNVQITDTATGT